MARLRVMYVVDGFGFGGTRTVLLSQIAQLPRDRVDAAILTLADDLDVATALAPPHVEVMSGPMPTILGYGVHHYMADAWLLRSARRSAGRALRAIASYKPDILHFHTHPRTLALGILASRASSLGLVFTDHAVRIAPTEYSPHARFLLKVAYRRLYKEYDLISVGASVAEANRAARLVGRHHRHVVMMNHVDIHRFRPPHDWLRARPLEVIYVGRLHPAKGVDTLIRGFAHMRTSVPVRLVIVGPDEMGGQLQAIAAKCIRAPKSVDFLGERADVPDLLRRASIAVLVSQREGQSLALLEQMASGLAMIVSNIPESTALVRDGLTGRIIPVGDEHACASALEELIADDTLRLKLGRAARQAAEGRESNDDAELLMDLYTHLAVTR